jgi:hypothetical protein
MTNGPYLYDDDPTPLHTGAPRGRNWSIVVVLALTVLAAVGTVVGMYVFRGSPADESEERARVFVAALGADDLETASALLCQEQRDGRSADEALEPYRAAAGGTVGEARAGEVDGGPAQLVPVRSADGTTTHLVLVPEGGPRVCGVLLGD